MRRMFWLAVGLGAGATAAILVARWASRQRQRMAPANLGRQAGQAVNSLVSVAGDLASEFRRAMAEKEAEVRASMPD